MIEKLQKILKKSFNECGYNIDPKVIISNRPTLCDYQCDEAFKLASSCKKSPIEIGQEVVANINSLSDFNKLFSKVEFIKPGFINISLSDDFINETISSMYNNEYFDIKRTDNPKNYFLDYGGPNVAKPLHVGHLRTAIIGESIKRIIKFKGHNTLADVHLGDFGLQIGQVIYAVLEDGLKIEEIDLKYLDEVYPKMSKLCKEDKELLEKCASITKKLQDGNNEYELIWKKICEVSVGDIKRLYNYLDVEFDFWYGESDGYKYIKEITDLLNQKKLLKLSDGAQIIEVNEDTDKLEIPPLVFQKSNGAYLYGTTDLASIYERVTKYASDNILYIVDNRQSLHFKQLFRVCNKLGINANLQHLPYGTVNGSDGKPFKTRSGDAFKLDDLFKEIKEFFVNSKETNKDMSDEDVNIIINSIIKYADLQNNREKDYIFDIEKFSNVVGKTGPYLLYTYVRMEKILKNEELNIANFNNIIYNVIDRDLRIKILQLENSFELAFKEKKPNYIAEYIYDLAVCCNSFYQANHINGLEDDVKQQWLLLIDLTNKIIKELLNLLIIDVPSQM